ncbi:SPOR domain-containing protein [bacterium]|nr:SPOR domain-containing protein [bacterium]
MKSRSFILLLVLSFLLPGLGQNSAGAQVPVLIPVKKESGRKARSERGREQEYVNLYRTSSDDWIPVWSPEPPMPATFDIGTRYQPSRTTTSADSATGEIRRTRRTQGFRVQLANVMSEEQARSIELRAKPLFENIYITFHSPNYKVRAGDFTRRSDADRAAGEAKAMGFRGAWVVPDRVIVVE